MFSNKEPQCVGPERRCEKGNYDQFSERVSKKSWSKIRNEITNYKTYTSKKGRKSIDKELEEIFSFVF